ncbi:hypothetical protein [Saccharolobus shibatae]|uniref:Uncharacterized protein n=1 Tax=Saccharolobus shibatae TaxID=2286 RepID=A0A8F5GUZ5_9CREN|nr:hypothetical protein [Saccharolobus shibatae]QXJ30348.1 Uncharacterized protein J5U21_p0090 [Saccharolobus shibatae]QXJ30450.1 Uncharacterized protein J5U21_00090 [Saccharolobus shibatae]
MDIRRFSVLFIAIIIILAFLASFANLKVPQQNTSIQIGTQTQTESYTQLELYKYIYNKTITLAPSLSDLQYVRANYANTKAPYYNISKNAYILFNFSTPTDNTLELLLGLLSRNASEIAPGPYGALLSVASSAYVQILNYTNTALQPFPLNKNDTENYSKYAIIVNYAKDFETPESFQHSWSYPPSDNITVSPLSYNIIDTYTVKVTISVSYSTSTSLASSSTSHNGNQTIVTKYYKMSVSGTVYLLANGSAIASNNFQFSYTAVPPYKLPYPGAPIYQQSFSISGNVIVPPSVEKAVYLSYNVTAYQYKKEHTSGNTTYICYYPTNPSFNYQPVYFNWYEYNVTVPINIEVFNGTNPITEANNNIYYGRDITVYFYYTTWSSYPNSNSTLITTYDNINVGGYNIKRMWNAGSIEIIPQLNTQSSGNTINYYLTFKVQDNLVQPPPWIDQPMTYNKYAAISWFYLEQNASLAHSLYEFIMKTINKTDLPYWKFEYFILASQFVMYTFNTTFSAFNNLLELESFYENWSIINAQILNLSAWPKLQYFNDLLMFFNVSKIPQIYNDTIFYNITGNYETYLVDIYNALYYKYWDRVPFGNPFYYVNPINNETVYFYKFSNENIPYIGEPLNFYYANYINSIYYAIFVYPKGNIEQITARWNGTAWIT